MTESAIEAKLDALAKSMDKGFERVHKDLDEVKADIKNINGEGLPRRVKKIEQDAEAARGEGLPRRVKRIEDWRDSIGKWWWALAAAGLVAVFAAWLSALFG